MDALRITHRHIDVFRALMTAGSVTAAAQALFTSQPTVSRELARLESLLGLPLFDRVRGRLLPNVQAMALFDEVQRSYAGLERIAAAAGRLRQSPGGVIRIACQPVFADTLLPAACAAFAATPSGAHAVVCITPLESPFLEESLAMQAHDLGLVEHDREVPGTQAQALLQVDEVAVLPAAHPLAPRRTLSPRDFEGLAFVDLAPSDSYRQRIDAWFAQARVRRRQVVETSSSSSVCAMVACGLGVGIVNPLSALHHAERGLVLRRLARPIRFSVGLRRPMHRAGDAAVDRFVAVLQREAAGLRRRVGERLAAA